MEDAVVSGIVCRTGDDAERCLKGPVAHQGFVFDAGFGCSPL